MIVPGTDTITKVYKIENRLGLHARPASMLVMAVKDLDVTIEVRKDEMVSNGKSILELIMLAAEMGHDLAITFQGPDARKAKKSVDELFASHFGEA